MILIGGLDPIPAKFVPGNQSADPWAQQIGVFDMTTLQWKDSYQFGANPYRSPGTVKDFYRQKYVSCTSTFYSMREY